MKMSPWAFTESERGVSPYSPPQFFAQSWVPSAAYETT